MTGKLFFFAGTILAFSTFASCKKDSAPPPEDQSGSILDYHLDTIWKSPDDSMSVHLVIETSKQPRSELYNDLTQIFDASVSYEIVAGMGKPFVMVVKFRHFPQNYSEFDPRGGSTYPVAEETFSRVEFNPPSFPNLSFYHFVPDPGPIDKIQINLKNP